MKTPRMVDLVRDYLAKRRALGFALRTQGPQLLQFARYADRLGHRGPLTLQLAVRWARLPKRTSALWWAHRLKVLRPFIQYRAAFDPRTELPPRGYLGPGYRRTTPHIYSATEIATLIRAARELRPPGGLRALTYATLLGLLACAGLRISEALRLRQADVDWPQGVISIRRSKFKQSRLVPLHPTALQALKHYARIRDQHVKAEHFFVSPRGQPLPYATVGDTFRRLVQRAVGNVGPRQRLPRLHELRHTFATGRLILQSGPRARPDSALLLVSIYLGHRRITDTYWYFSGTPELFAQVGRTFERFAHTAPP
jgi:integrase